MCGFAGVLNPTKSGRSLLPAVQCVAQTLAHRGPDDAGLWCDPDHGVALGFRRLAVVDLSEAGHQPMQSASGRYVIGFNGEVYNAPDLREQLRRAGYAAEFRGHSDTETMLAAIATWGLRPALERFVGMFAFALWDRSSRSLHLVRDRLGVKPLYYGRIGGDFVFGSEVRTLRAYPGFDAGIDRAALALFLRHNYVPAPLSIFDGVQKLRPGCILTVDASGREDETPYWSVEASFIDGWRRPSELSEADAINQLDEVLRDSVRIRMGADVPVGVFLSGGIDSSLVASIMQAQSVRPVRSFAVGFDTAGFDESRDAERVAAHLGTSHVSMRVTAAEAIDAVPRMPEVYDEPFADSSQVGTYLVCALARRHVTVALSGDGGDELFGGYDRYRWIRDVSRALGLTPRRLRHALGSVVVGVGADRISAMLRAVSPVLPRKLRMRNPARQLERLAHIARASGPGAAYQSLIAHLADPLDLVLGCDRQALAGADPWTWTELGEIETQAMLADLRSYLPDDIMVKVDRASMAVALEAREPLLDHRVVEFASRLPVRLKMRDGQGKWILRQVLDRYVPRALVERPKAGFSVPIAEWLRGPLRPWAEDLLDERGLAVDGFLHAKAVRHLWSEHLAGRSFGHLLWNVLMFQGWRRTTYSRALFGDASVTGDKGGGACGQVGAAW